MLVTCSYDYLSDDFNNRSYIVFAFCFNYLLPMVLVFFYYSSIVKAVWAHEEALKAQAKKMNVESLRSNQVTFTHTSYCKYSRHSSYLITSCLFHKKFLIIFSQIAIIYEIYDYLNDGKERSKFGHFCKSVLFGSIKIYGIGPRGLIDACDKTLIFFRLITYLYWPPNRH